MIRQYLLCLFGNHHMQFSSGETQYGSFTAVHFDTYRCAHCGKQSMHIHSRVLEEACS